MLGRKRNDGWKKNLLGLRVASLLVVVWVMLMGMLVEAQSMQSVNMQKVTNLKKDRPTRQRLSDFTEFTRGNMTLLTTSEGGFTLRRSSDGKWLLYPSDTSYISINVDGNIYVQPHAWTEEGKQLSLVGGSNTQGGPIFTYRLPDLPVQVEIAFIVKPDWIIIQTKVANNDSRNHTVAVRYLLDTQLDENDGAPLFAPGVTDPITGQAVVTHEVTVTNPVFRTWKAFDQPVNPTLTTIGTLIQSPVRLAFAHWPKAVEASWDYTTDPNVLFFTPGFLTSPESDSCVLIWFDNRTVAPGQATTYETVYGLAISSQPIRLIAPWSVGQWWQPSTYDGHPPENALDFNKVTNVREEWPYADGVEDKGEPIRAAHDGIVISVRKDDPGSGYGKYVDIQSLEDPDYFTRYAHLDSVMVNQGDFVTAGQVIGTCGETGEAYGSHLHFELQHKTQGAIPISEIDGQQVEIDFSRKDSLGRYLGRPIQSRSRSAIYQQVVNALMRLKRTIRPAVRNWVDTTSRILAEAIIKTKPDIAKEALKAVFSLGVGIAVSKLTPDEISALSQFSRLLRIHNTGWNVGMIIEGVVEQIHTNATVDEAYNKFRSSLWGALEDMVQQAENALQEAIDTLPDPLPPGFNAQAVIKKAEVASNILQTASSNSLNMCPIDFLPNGEILMLPGGAVYSWKNIHEQLLNKYQSVQTISDASWIVSVGAGGVKVGAALFTSGLSLGAELAVTGIRIGAGLVSGWTNYVKFTSRVELIKNALKAKWATVADIETLRNYAIKFSDWVKNEVLRKGQVVYRQIAGRGNLLIESLILPTLSIAPSGIAVGEAIVTIKNVGDGDDACVVVLNLYWQPPQSNDLWHISERVSDTAIVPPGASQTVRIPVQVPALWGNTPGRIKVVANAATASGFNTNHITIEVVATPTGEPQLPLSESNLILTGTIEEGSAREASFLVPPDKSTVQFVLSYDVGELDLHVYDANGRHIGVNYQTGEPEIQIPGATYTGSASNPEVISIPNAAGQNFIVRVISIFGPGRLSYFTGRQQAGDQNGSIFSVTAITRAISPASLSVLPSPITITVESTQTTADGEFQIVESGGDTEVRNITVTVTDLTTQTGQTIPATAINVSIDSTNIGAGQRVGGRITVNLSSNISDGIYQGTIKVTGQDVNNGTNLLIEVPLRILRMRFGEVRIPSGLSIISLPFAPTNRSVELIFGELAINGFVARYDSLSGKYVYSTDPNFGEITTGEAVWVKSPEDSQYVLPGFISQDTIIHIKRGWNLVGNPVTQVIEWNLSQLLVRRGSETKTLSQAQQAGWIEDYAWGWEQDANNPNTGRYVLIYDTNIIPGVKGQLEPWKGYWVYAHTDCELILPPPSQSKGRGTRDRGQVAKGNGWSMRLQASVNGSIGEAVMGIANGTRGLAVGLPPEPPTGNNGVQVILLKNNTPLAVDVRSDGSRKQEWEVLVRWDRGQMTRGMVERKEVVLTFDGIGYAPKDVSVWLVDTVTGKRLYLRTQPSYRFVAQEGEVERRFKLIVEKGNDRPLRVVGLKATPIRGQGIVISFSLTKPAQVFVEVLTLTGRKVAVLEGSSSKVAGEQRMVWRGISDEGLAVSSGAYLVRVIAIDDEGRQVQGMTVVRVR